MFDLVFLLDPSFKSSFAQNESCRSSLPLQLLFWPNFKFLYQNLSFGGSNSSQIHSNVHCVLQCFYCDAQTPIPRPATRRRRHASAIAPRPRRPSAALILARALEASHPFPSPSPFLALARSQDEQSSPSTPLVVPRHPLVAPPRSFAPRAARPRPEPTPPLHELGRALRRPKSGNRPPPAIAVLAELRPLRRATPPAVLRSIRVLGELPRKPLLLPDPFSP